MKISVVIDLGFGDAGKGLTVDYLASQDPASSLVIRFSGGHQVSHTVTLDDFRHTFNNFGSGTLRGVPTFYSEHTTLFPPSITREAYILADYHPQLFVHPLAMITTPYDIAWNRATEFLAGNGSCGVGFGATIARNLDGVKLTAKDLLFDWVLEQKLQAIKKYYSNKAINQHLSEIGGLYEDELINYDISVFIDDCKQSIQWIHFHQLHEIVGNFDHLIFEGSQGVLLDQDHGIFPHTTPSYTTSRNAMEIITHSLPALATPIELYYVSRCYQTRHGNGPMSSEEPVELLNAAQEANVENEYQGPFRTAKLDTALLRYAMASDRTCHPHENIHYNLMVTCLDQLPDFDVQQLVKSLSFDFDKVLGSYSPEAITVLELETK